jgi:hypothetical protein
VPSPVTGGVRFPAALVVGPGEEAGEAKVGSPTSAAQAIYDEAFSPDSPRSPRSPEYKAGVLALLRSKLEGGSVRDPFPEGTAASDAFGAGVAEGLHWLSVKGVLG